jgi:hypothetical protein
MTAIEALDKLMLIEIDSVGTVGMAEIHPMYCSCDLCR